MLAEVPADAAIVVGGDVVCGPRPQETFDRLQSLGDRVTWIRGNGERELREQGLAPPEVSAWVRSRLTPETVDRLVALPLTHAREGVLYCHATPRNDEDIFTELTPEERLVGIFETVEQDIVVCGHTHMQFDRVIAGRRVVNAGSVGMAYDEPAGAYWRLDLEPRCTPYELDLGDWPFEWPAAPREEALAFFTSRGL